MTSPEMDHVTRMVESFASQLSEHVDSVQIFVTKQKDGGNGTMSYDKGYGNWFARYGYVRYWLINEDERSREEIRNLNKS